MKIGLLHTRLRRDENRIIAAAEGRGHEIVLLDDSALAFDLTQSPPAVDVVLERGIHHGRALTSLRVFEAFGVRAVNSAQTAEWCGNKLLVSERLLKAGLAMPETIVAFSPEEALAAAEKLGYPVVMKPAIGSWGALLSRLNDRHAAQAVILHKEKLGSYHHQVFYVQKYLETGGKSLRVFVFGGEVVAAVEYQASDWNTAEGSAVAAFVSDTELTEIAIRAALEVQGDLVAVDVLRLGGQYYILEVEYTVELDPIAAVVETDSLIAKIIDVLEQKGRNK